MIFRLRQIDVTADGRRIARDRDIDKHQLTIGRATENDIHLPDLAVEPQQAVLTELGANRIGIEATGTLGFILDGAQASSVVIGCRNGAELRFGSSRISVSLDTDEAVLLTIERIETDPEAGDEKRGVSLNTILPSRRKIAWLAVLLILGLFLVLPIASHLKHGPDPSAQVIGDKSWSPGKLSLVHHALDQRCQACHVRPFESVRDTACQTCHKNIDNHAPPARLAGAQGDAPLGERFLRAVAHKFGKPGPGACVECHREHEGAGKIALPAQQFCAGCHGTLRDRLADTKLGNAWDFGSLHPQFTPQIVTDPGSRAMRRISLDDHPHENGGLFFPHKLHLDSLGGVAKMASTLRAERGYGNQLACKDCHHPTEDGVRFLPVRMERDCEACHSLVYDRVGPTFRTLKHGNIPQMIADISLAQPSRVVVPIRQRPGEFAEGGRYYSNFTSSGGGSVLSRAFSRQGVCGECHTPAYSGGQVSVTPVTQPARYMLNGWFDHKAHAKEKCSSCHHAEASTSASDLLLPGISQCRTCHLGENARAPVPSSCAMCHSYHPAASAPREAKPER